MACSPFQARSFLPALSGLLLRDIITTFYLKLIHRRGPFGFASSPAMHKAFQQRQRDEVSRKEYAFETP